MGKGFMGSQRAEFAVIWGEGGSWGAYLLIWRYSQGERWKGKELTRLIRT